MENVAEIIFRCSSRYRYDFNEFCIKVKWEINNNLFLTQKGTYWKLSENTHVINGNVRKVLESDKRLKMFSERICYKIGWDKSKKSINKTYCRL